MAVSFDNPSIHLGKLLRSSGEASVEGEFSRLAYTQNDVPAVLETREPAFYEVEVHTVDDNDFWLHGRIEALVLQECSRCLRPVDVPLEVTLGTLLRFDPKIEIPFLDEDESGQEVWVFNETVLELSPYFAESIFMALPLRVLHSPDCKGLCSACGVDLNEGLCGKPNCIFTSVPQAAPVKASEKPNPFAVLSSLELPDE